MRLITILASLATLLVSVRSQDALSALAKAMPNCSLACFTLELPQSSCAQDLTSECLCTNVALNAAVSACAQKTCTIYELLQTKNVSGHGCGVPVRDRTRDFIVIGMCGIIVAILAFVLRLGASLLENGRKISWDDATMGLVVLLSVPPAVFTFFLADNGLGRDMWTLKDYQITNVLRYFIAGEIFYILALGVTKISILCFYLRVFPAKDFRRIIYGTMALAVAYTLAFFFATLFQCTPISYAWTQWDGLHEGTCNNIHLQGWIAAGINIILDAIVMVLPLKHLAGLNMNLRKKVMVMAMFSVGLIVIVISILRLETLAHFANSKNVTWDYFEAGYWSLLEIDVSIICGSMPAHRLLLSRMWPKVKQTFSSGKSASTSSAALAGFRASTADKKAASISVKPRIEDAEDFVPLVDMESGILHPSTINKMTLVREQCNRTSQDSTRESHGTNNLGAERPISDERLNGWPMANEKVGKTYV